MQLLIQSELHTLHAASAMGTSHQDKLAMSFIMESLVKSVLVEVAVLVIVLMPCSPLTLWRSTTKSSLPPESLWHRCSSR